MKKKKMSAITSIISFYNVIVILLGILFYFLIPELLNYGPEVINSYFETQIDAGYNYYVQYIVVIIGILIVIDFLIWSQIRILRKVDEKSLDEKSKEKIKEQCFRIPYRLYMSQIIVIPLSVGIMLFLTGTEAGLTTKIVLMAAAFAILLSVSSYVFTKRKVKEILIRLNNLEIYSGKVNINLKNKIFLQIIPLILVTSIFLALTGYSRLIYESGNEKYEEYKTRLSVVFKSIPTSGDNLLATCKKIDKINSDDEIFIIKNNKDFFNEGEKLSDFFVKYSYIVGHRYEGHLYDYYGSDVQGTAEYLKIDDSSYIVGVKYSLLSKSMLMLFLTSTLAMLIISILILIYFSDDISADIVEVAKNLGKIAEKGEINFDDKLVVTSNDEIGELVIAFNKILDLEKQNIENIERNQEILVEQERLSSLGQLIGGIAHNLKTPIMSIAGALEGLTDLIKEYDESIEDPKVTEADHHDIAKDMQVWVDKIRPYLSYMTEVIDTVKGQAVSMNASTMDHFNAKELFARTRILLRDELKKKHCTLNLDLNVDENSYISGEISAIIQVIDNLIINAIDAYKGESGNIDLKVWENVSKIFIEVKDYGPGIPENVQERLFKEMVTSKGKNGTGLGLYMSYSTVKGKFDGDMTYKTGPNGTTFLIELNKEKKM